MSEAHNHIISIGGDQYTIVSDESYEAVEKVAQRVDEALCEISKKTGSQNSKRCAVLAAIKFAYQLQKLEHDLQMKNNEEGVY